MESTLKHCDYSNLPSFARVVEEAFGHASHGGDGVAVLPNREVMAACLRDGGKRTRDVLVRVAYDGETATAYQVGHREWGEIVLIDAATGETTVYEPGSGDEETAAQWEQALAELPTARVSA